VQVLSVTFIRSNSCHVCMSSGSAPPIPASFRTAVGAVPTISSNVAIATEQRKSGLLDAACGTMIAAIDGNLPAGTAEHRDHASI
jgi:hypothetical protein